MIIIASNGALGGGSLRDTLLDRPVFWIHDPSSLYITILAALVTFYLALRVRLPANLFLLPDALGLALFAVIGTLTRTNKKPQTSNPGLGRRAGRLTTSSDSPAHP